MYMHILAGNTQKSMSTWVALFRIGMYKRQSIYVLKLSDKNINEVVMQSY